MALVGGSGSGKSTVYGGAGSEYIVGGSGDDSLVGGTGNDTILAGGDGDAVLLEHSLLAGKHKEGLLAAGGGVDELDVIFLGFGGRSAWTCGWFGLAGCGRGSG